MCTPVTCECGHSFCYDCVHSWFENKLNCPTCRAAVETKPILNLNLKDIGNNIIELLMSTSKVEETSRLKKQRDRSLKYYDDDYKNNNLFGQLFNVVPTLIDTSDGVPRCGYCHWEARGDICERCGHSLRRGNDDFSDEDQNFEESEDLAIALDGPNEYDSQDSFIDPRNDTEVHDWNGFDDDLNTDDEIADLGSPDDDLGSPDHVEISDEEEMRHGHIRRSRDTPTHDSDGFYHYSDVEDEEEMGHGHGRRSRDTPSHEEMGHGHSRRSRDTPTHDSDGFYYHSDVEDEEEMGHGHSRRSRDTPTHDSDGFYYHSDVEDALDRFHNDDLSQQGYNERYFSDEDEFRNSNSRGRVISISDDDS